jgi:hypothetical protein
MISEKQRKTFFMLCNKIGKDNVYEVMYNTIGITSLRDSALTFNKMKIVLAEVLKLSDLSIRRKPKAKAFTRPIDSLEDRKVCRVIRLVSPAQIRFIENLKDKTGLTDKKYSSYCRRILKKDKPETSKEAQAIISGLKSIKYQGWKAKKQVKSL